ncbi:MAG: adenylate/guanylate cyclase domain-containing protein [Hyphomicrobiales bacterium]
MKFRLLPTFLICLSALTIASVGTVIYLQQWSGRQLISNLGARIVTGNLNAIKLDVDTFLIRQRKHVLAVEEFLEDAGMEFANTNELSPFIEGIMVSDPHIAHIIVVDRDHRGIIAHRSRTNSKPVIRLLSGAYPSSLKKVIQEGHLRANAMHLSKPWFDPISDQTLISLSREVSRPNNHFSFIEIAVSIAPLSLHTRAMSGSTNNIVFALLNDDYVLAHPLLAQSPVGLSHDEPLPSRDVLGDGVLKAIDTAVDSPLVARALLNGAKLQNVTWGGRSYLISRLELKHKFGDQVITVGTHRQNAEVREYLKVFYFALWVAGGVLILSLLAAAVLARRISHPIRRISAAASDVGQVEFGEIKPLGGSFIKELNDLASSFNSMIGGLKLFERYVPRSLVKKLIERGEQRIPSEERVVTVLFTDIAGFTSLSEGMAASGVAEFTNEHLTLLGACVEAEGGTIDKYIGDSLMAFWGAPDDMEDHAQAACRAAANIARNLHADNLKRKERGLAPVRIRVGIHTGPLIVGDIGSPNRINYTIMGDTVNVAARLEALGKEVDPKAEALILISGKTADELGGEFIVREEGAYTVRGKSIATTVFRLVP